MKSFKLFLFILFSFQIQGQSCYYFGSYNTRCGEDNGSAFVIEADAGLPQVLWSNGSTSSSISNLSEGNYSVTITTDCGVDIETFVIQGGSLPLPFDINTTNTTCGLDNGAAYLQLTNTSDYSYNEFSFAWSNSDDQTYTSGLSSGSYFVTISYYPNNELYCTNTLSFNIATSTPITGDIYPLNTTCNLTNGGATVLAAGGGSSNTYLWNNGSTNSALSSLAPGNYTVTISSNDQCTPLVLNTTVEQSTPISGDIYPLNTTCNLNNGAATVLAAGGGSSNTYLWNNGSTNSALSSLTPGNYAVTVSSSDQCPPLVLNTTVEPSNGLVSSIKITQTKCGLDNGYLEAFPSGNNYQWSNGSNTQYIENLASGDYIVTVTDADGCISTSLAFINPSIELNTNIATNGSILLSLQENAKYQWINCADKTPIAGATNQSFTPLVSGEYAVEIWNGLAAPLDCQALSDCEEIIISATEDSEVLKMIIPSLIVDNCVIESTEITHPIFISLYNPSGILLYSNVFLNQEAMIINMDHLPSGLYFINYNYRNITKSSKVVKL